MRRRLSILIGLLLLASVVAAEEKPPRIQPADARQHVGRKAEVVFQVQASKHSEKRQTVFLDSELDFHDEQNLGIQLSERAVAELKQQRNVSEPTEFYRDKTIRVVGEIVIEEERPYIKVDSAAQLDLYDESTQP